MSHDPSPLKYMGTQSRETVNMAAALAHEVDRQAGSAVDRVADTGSKVGDAADWALGKAKDALHSAAEKARERATTAVADYTREDPIRAVLIAAGVGALLMIVLARMASSGVRSVERRVRR